ncbi:MAG: hypothetical protein AAGI01_00475, partial [Myxococcota bacterium]
MKKRDLMNLQRIGVRVFAWGASVALATTLLACGPREDDTDSGDDDGTTSNNAPGATSGVPGGAGDVGAPVVTITSRAMTDREGRYTLTGTVTEGVELTKLTYKLGRMGERVEIDAAPTFTEELVVKAEGKTELIVEATDASGSVGEAALVVTRPTANQLIFALEVPEHAELKIPTELTATMVDNPVGDASEVSFTWTIEEGARARTTRGTSLFAAWRTPGVKTLTVGASADGAESATVEATVEVREPGEERAVLRGEVLDIQGRPISGARLFDGETELAVSEADGSFEVLLADDVVTTLRVEAAGQRPQMRRLAAPSGKPTPYASITMLPSVEMLACTQGVEPCVLPAQRLSFPQRIEDTDFTTLTIPTGSLKHSDGSTFTGIPRASLSGPGGGWPSPFLNFLEALPEQTMALTDEGGLRLFGFGTAFIVDVGVPDDVVIDEDNPIIARFMGNYMWLSGDLHRDFVFLRLDEELGLWRPIRTLSREEVHNSFHNRDNIIELKIKEKRGIYTIAQYVENTAAQKFEIEGVEEKDTLNFSLTGIIPEGNFKIVQRIGNANEFEVSMPFYQDPQDTDFKYQANAVIRSASGNKILSFDPSFKCYKGSNKPLTCQAWTTKLKLLNLETHQGFEMRRLDLEEFKGRKYVPMPTAQEVQNHGYGVTGGVHSGAIFHEFEVERGDLIRISPTNSMHRTIIIDQEGRATEIRATQGQMTTWRIPKSGIYRLMSSVQVGGFNYSGLSIGSARLQHTPAEELPPLVERKEEMNITLPGSGRRSVSMDIKVNTGETISIVSLDPLAQGRNSRSSDTGTYFALEHGDALFERIYSEEITTNPYSPAKSSLIKVKESGTVTLEVHANQLVPENHISRLVVRNVAAPEVLDVQAPSAKLNIQDMKPGEVRLFEASASLGDGVFVSARPTTTGEDLVLLASKGRYFQPLGPTHVQAGGSRCERTMEDAPSLQNKSACYGTINDTFRTEDPRNKNNSLSVSHSLLTFVLVAAEKGVTNAELEVAIAKRGQYFLVGECAGA